MAIIGAIVGFVFWCWFCFLMYVLLWGITGGPARERKRNTIAWQKEMVGSMQQTLRTEMVRVRADAIINGQPIPDYNRPTTSATWGSGPALSQLTDDELADVDASTLSHGARKVLRAERTARGWY